MHGTITAFSNDTATGSIQSTEGVRFKFDLGAVLAYDAARMATGHLVYFDLADRSSRKAINISIEPLHASRSGEHRPDAVQELRYAGFEQCGNVRTYRYERMRPNETSQPITVDADLALFNKHRIGIQEGPAICLRLVAAEVGAGWTRQLMEPLALASHDMEAYLAGRPTRDVKPGPKTS